MGEPEQNHKYITNFEDSNQPFITSDRNFSVYYKNGKNIPWLFRALEDVESSAPFFEVIAAELYHALLPFSAKKHRTLFGRDRYNKLTLLGSVTQKHPTKLGQTTFENAAYFPEKIAPHLVLAYFLEDSDPNERNLDIFAGDKGIRVDFEFFLYDFRDDLCHNREVKWFRGSPINDKAFQIDAVDLEQFPDVKITKFFKLLDRRRDDYAKAILTKWRNSDVFNKVAHQYFLKILLFDHELLEPIIHAHASPQAVMKDLANHLNSRRTLLLQELVQVAKFRKNVVNNFTEYKANIIKEFQAYNVQFNKTGKSKRKAAYYENRIININRIEEKLNELYRIIHGCETLPKKIKDSFGLYFARMKLVWPDIDASSLCNIVTKQINNKYYYFYYSDDNNDRKFSNIIASYQSPYNSSLENAEICFYINKEASESLMRQLIVRNERIEQIISFVKSKFKALKYLSASNCKPMTQELLQECMACFEGMDNSLYYQNTFAPIQFLKAIVGACHRQESNNDAYFLIDEIFNIKLKLIDPKMENRIQPQLAIEHDYFKKSNYTLDKYLHYINGIISEAIIDKVFHLSFNHHEMVCNIIFSKTTDKVQTTVLSLQATLETATFITMLNSSMTYGQGVAQRGDHEKARDYFDRISLICDKVSQHDAPTEELLNPNDSSNPLNQHVGPKKILAWFMNTERRNHLLALIESANKLALKPR